MRTQFDGWYRIVETRYGYMVEGKTVKTTGLLWWKKEVEEWKFLNHGGKPDYVVNSKPPFRTFAAAAKWLHEVTVKEIEGLRAWAKSQTLPS